MRLIPHTVRQFADALLAMLPLGAAWKWPEGGLGDKIMAAAAEELVRVEVATQDVLDNAIETHRPAITSWHIDEYRRVANEALEGQTEAVPRQPTIVGRARAGKRLWSENAETLTFPIKLLQIDHLLGPLMAGKSLTGQCVRGERSRYVLRVRYYATVVEPDVIAAALQAFKQSHVALWFEDITGRAGNIYYA